MPLQVVCLACSRTWVATHNKKQQRSTSDTNATRVDISGDRTLVSAEFAFFFSLPFFTIAPSHFFLGELMSTGDEPREIYDADVVTFLF